MAKAKLQAAAQTATTAPKAAPGQASEETLARLEQGLRPFTLLEGTHHETIEVEGEAPRLSEKYVAGDVVYSKRDLAAIWPGRFVAGTSAPTAAGVIETPGLGENVGNAIDTNGFDVYTKNGVLWAYRPGQYGAPASGALMDLAAAEEWCASNSVDAAE